MVNYDRTIPPGGEGKITLKVNTRNRRGKLTKRALVLTNDPTNKAVKISVSGTVKALISVEPRSYVFLTGLPDEDIIEEVRIVADQVPKFTIKEITDNLKGKVEYKLTTVEKGKEYILTITNKYKKVGNYYGEINILTDNPKKPKIRIRISGRIKGELIAIPKIVYFGRIMEDNKNLSHNLTKQIIIKDIKKKPFKIVRLDYNKKLFNIDINETDNKNVWRLKVTPKIKNMKKGVNYDLLKIKTDVKNYSELSVGLRIFVQ
ncbi:MAG: hypothetical protein DRG83_01355 [Deltaproteobacteria bacterium]|nr:MAG: hypothetical protein DRG83_01355 [Deltaproteobacteria bacterium]